MTVSHRPWSCDTFATSRSHTVYGATVLGKNSDRPARESQPLRRLEPRRGNSRLRLAYLEIDDVDETIPHLGSSPYWCWGHEAGVNAHGVAIGNEALFTRDLVANAARHRSGGNVEPGILGMELLRIALERASTAQKAIEVMAGLVEQYGQWGAGTVSRMRAEAAYDNSYIVADSHEIWVLETSGRHWVSKRIDEPVWAVSNEPTIRTDWTGCSSELRAHAREQGWTGTEDPLDFAEVFTDPETSLQVSHIRLQRSRQMLGDALKAGALDFHDARRVLADHYEDTFLAGPKFNPARPDFHTLCMHEHPAGFTWGNTASSVIAVLPTKATPYMWWAAATPCTSVYLPVAVTGAQLPPTLSRAGTQHGEGPNPEEAADDRFSAGSYWWTFQTLLETIAGDARGSVYLERQPLVRARFDELQQRWLDEVDALAADGSPAQWDALTERCTHEALVTAQQLLDEFQRTR